MPLVGSAMVFGGSCRPIVILESRSRHLEKDGSLRHSKIIFMTVCAECYDSNRTTFKWKISRLTSVNSDAKSMDFNLKVNMIFKLQTTQ